MLPLWRWKAPEEEFNALAGFPIFFRNTAVPAPAVLWKGSGSRRGRQQFRPMNCTTISSNPSD
jgi:hypothetical protein